MLDVNGLIRVLHHLHITNAYFNYEGDGTVLADNDPFAVAEVYFVDVRFYKGHQEEIRVRNHHFMGITIKGKTPLDNFTKMIT